MLVVPVSFTLLATESPLLSSVQIVNAVPATADEDYIVPYFVDGLSAYVAVPSTEVDDDVFYGEYCFALMTIEKFYELYGSNATMPQLNYYWMSESESEE